MITKQKLEDLKAPFGGIKIKEGLFLGDYSAAEVF